MFNSNQCDGFSETNAYLKDELPEFFARACVHMQFLERVPKFHPSSQEPVCLGALGEASPWPLAWGSMKNFSLVCDQMWKIRAIEN